MDSIPYDYIGDIDRPSDMDVISERIGYPGGFNSLTAAYSRDSYPVFDCNESTIEAFTRIYYTDIMFVSFYLLAYLFLPT